jgi:anthranilate phosphoribosyltransferase
MVVHGLEGIDEISVTERTLVSHLKDGLIETHEYVPGDFGLGHAGLLKRRSVSDADDGAMVALEVLRGELKEDDGCTQMVLVNSAACLILGQKAGSFSEGIELAKSSIRSGNAIGKLEKMVEFSGGSTDVVMEKYAKKQKG